MQMKFSEKCNQFSQATLCFKRFMACEVCWSTCLDSFKQKKRRKRSGNGAKTNEWKNMNRNVFFLFHLHCHCEYFTKKTCLKYENCKTIRVSVAKNHFPIFRFTLYEGLRRKLKVQILIEIFAFHMQRIP